MARSATHGARTEVTGRDGNSQVQRSTISRGGSIGEHAHDSDVRFMVMSGRGRVTGKQKQDVSAGDSVVIAAGQSHGWENTGSEDFVFMGVFPMETGKGGVQIEDVAHGADMKVQRSTIAPKGSIAEHSHDVDASFVVVGGKGKLTGTGGRDVAAGDVVYIAAKQKHGWSASGNEPLVILGTFGPANLAARGVRIEVVEEGKGIRIERSTLSRGGSIADHAHGEASTFVVASGSGALTGKHARTVRAGDTVIIGAGEPHGWRNTGSDTMTIVGTFAAKG